MLDRPKPKRAQPHAAETPMDASDEVVAALDDEANFGHSYIPPAQDKTRGEYHTWFKKAERHGGVDSGGDGLKTAVSSFENSWYIAAALTMTMGFGMIMYVPEGRYPGSMGDTVALYVYVALVLFGTMNAVLGVWWAGHMVPQVAWHPASHFSKFWFAALNTTNGISQQFAKVSMQQLWLSLLPLCYLNFGAPGLALSLSSVLYLQLQLKTWAHQMQRMRDGYTEGMASHMPLIDDISHVPFIMRGPHQPGVFGTITAQMLGTVAFAFRWALPHRGFLNSSGGRSDYGRHAGCLGHSFSGIQDGKIHSSSSAPHRHEIDDETPPDDSVMC